MERKTRSRKLLTIFLMSTLMLAFNLAVAELNDVGRVELTSGTGLFEMQISDGWPMFHHDLAHSGHAISIAPNNNATAWSYTTGDAIISSPAAANGKVFVGSNDFKIYALDEKTGAFVWSFTTGGSVSSSPAVANGMVYVGSSDNKVYALNENTGVHVWNYTTGGPVASSPAAADGKVFVGSSDGKVYALNQNTGMLAWNYTTGMSMRSSPAVVNGKVFIGSEGGRFYAFDANSGSLVWYYDAGSSIVTSPAVANGMVFFGAHNSKIYALNETTGTLIWSYTTGAYWIYSSPAVADGKVFVGAYDYKVYALNASTGAKIWSYTTGNWIYSSPAVADDKVFVGSYDNKIYALNEATGALMWSYNTLGAVRSSPAIADGMVFIGASDKKLYAFGIHDVAVLSITPSKTTANQGDTVNIDVVVKNEGNFTETFNVSLFYNANLIETKQVSLSFVTATTLAFYWNTSLVPLGNYTLSAGAEIVSGETDTADNSFIDGIIRIVKFPVARFTYAPTIPRVGEVVTFNASTSTGNGGEIVSYSWDFGDSSYGSGNVTTHAYPSFGNYTVVLTVTDSEGFTDTENATIRVIDYPVANFTYLPAMILVNETMTCDASGSTPKGGTIISYSWDFGDSGYGLGKIVNHTYASAGNFAITLNVTDDEGLWDITQTMIRAYARPKASFFFYPTAPMAGRLVYFNASTSIDVDGVIVSYIWNFSDGTPIAIGESVIHSFVVNGTYPVKLTVVDNDGLNNTMTFNVTVGLTIIGDVTGPYGMPDGIVNMIDIAFVARAFGTDPEHQAHPPRWDPRADISGPTYGEPDQKVNMFDVALVAKNFGKKVT